MGKVEVLFPSAGMAGAHGDAKSVKVDLQDLPADPHVDPGADMLHRDAVVEAVQFDVIVLEHRRPCPLSRVKD